MTVKLLFARAIALGMATLWLAGCATTAGQSPEKTVEQRANAYWQARVGQKTEQAYSYLTPAYRAVRTQEHYQRELGSAAQIQAVKVSQVNCAEKRCTVRLKVTAKPLIIGIKLDSIDTYMEEVWLLDEGQWWRHQDL